MATKKLYYDDPYMCKFNASVLKSGKDDNDRFYVVLDRTAFYPTGGGQPHDTGTLNSVQVYDVQEIDGEVRHYTRVPVDTNHGIAGEIDWEKRFDHMQQHAGQHILSAAFEREFDYKTVSFHLGREICTIDLDTVDLSGEEIMMVENKVNDIILENRRLVTKWVDAEDLSQYPLRKEVSVSKNIRLVIIPDFDYNGCGGTHPDSTGQVSSLKILHWEKQKKNTRVYFVCGSRVLKELGMKHQAIQGLSDTLNAPQEALNKTAIKVLQQNKELEKKINELKTELIDYEAEAYIEKAEEIWGRKIIRTVFDNRPMSELQLLAKRITVRSGDTIVLFVNESKGKLQLVCAKGESVEAKMNELVKKVLSLINGKGGGNASVAQGGGEKIIPPEKLIETMINRL
ncbi:alanyl-tRNA editing protein [Virgibacillus sp. NKC19-16]|uniref:alanyl-tRNA editing protein n=1 Tax=Virgibacillus salidurans TaxID=2831673 RepID=UPI001F2A37EC|nr:DHHA1 domain-containing protein [Virgibacillus sp. NKC19-16]UJL47187.1 alanyl-tRNA editing protein [Virgibacillus sp. NKC19-16]